LFGIGLSVDISAAPWFIYQYALCFQLPEIIAAEWEMPFLVIRIGEVDIGFDDMQVAERIVFQLFRQVFNGFGTANAGRNLQDSFGFRTDDFYGKYPYQPDLSEICDYSFGQLQTNALLGFACAGTDMRRKTDFSGFQNGGIYRWLFLEYIYPGIGYLSRSD